MSEYVNAELRRTQAVLTNACNDLDRAKIALANAMGELSAASDVRSSADHEREAVRAVLDAVLHSLRWRGLDRKRFRALIAEEGRRTPSVGERAVKHVVLLTEAQRVLGVKPER